MPLPPGLLPPIELLLLAAIGVYLLPAIIAYARRHPQRRAIAVLNVLTGWAVQSWLQALLMSLSKKDLPPSR